MPGLLRGIARTAVVAGTATAVSNRVSRRQAGRWAQQEAYPPQPTYQQAQPVYVAQPDDQGDEMDARLDQLRKLSDLKAQGVLTEEEFQQQKQRILNQ
ncbi:MAG TPA: SHOCT domain-containing protein [Actinophytocola sp.]|uniref:SHOCT domain-containing protein n=1 Tax=Actinophytocola sp. TaxID=1872138 RepID=UPI002DBC2D98|nr:SHOCT domain-containing protein [Actinophytocola sp.]HEU5475620.1 SHOCT domain-containing protein [Actinophytocola sp.]